jgi:hypothetical protein
VARGDPITDLTSGSEARPRQSGFGRRRVGFIGSTLWRGALTGIGAPSAPDASSLPSWSCPDRRARLAPNSGPQPTLTRQTYSVVHRGDCTRGPHKFGARTQGQSEFQKANNPHTVVSGRVGQPRGTNSSTSRTWAAEHRRAGRVWTRPISLTSVTGAGASTFSVAGLRFRSRHDLELAPGHVMWRPRP